MKSDSSTGKMDHFEFIAGLRGLAALYVVVFHMVLVPKFQPSAPEYLEGFIMAGDSGVALFFVISAFTLTYSLREREGEPNPIGRFYLRRLFRILPLFYAWLLLSSVRDYVVSGMWPSLGKTILNIIFGYNFVPGRHEGIVWASWTLGVELIVYLIFPLIYFFAKNIRRSVALLFFSVVAAFLFKAALQMTSMSTLESEGYLHMSFFTQLPVFVFGVVVFLVFERFIWKKPKSPLLGTVLVLAAILVWSFAAFKAPFLADLHVAPWRWYIYSLSYGLLTCGLAVLPVGMVGDKVVLFFGKISYSLYLNHPTCIFLLSPIYKRIYELGVNGSVAFFLCLVLTLAVLTPISYLTYRFIEKPGANFGRWLINRSSAKTASPRSFGAVSRV